ncbi:hypothetical protein [Agathobaculum butyriciproducens]|uniref:hypothetical protein n=1 Tax=Agathobaculum butyriciproducens TaxID=1628085 RepID=UPI0036D234FB
MENEKTGIISAKYITEQTNHMEYQPVWTTSAPEVQDGIISHMNAYDADAYTAADVLRALPQDILSPEGLAHCCLPAALLPFLEQMAQRASRNAQAFRQLGADVHAAVHRCANYCIYAVSTVITRFAIASWIWTRSNRN